jgi:peptide deformylase
MGGIYDDNKFSKRRGCRIGEMDLSIYEIVKEGNPILREKAKPIPKVNDAIIRLLDNLKDTLHVTPRGVGLAAPQIGIGKRAFVIELAESEVYIEMINPQLSSLGGKEEGWEGCLSVPGVEGLVPRAERLTVKYMDREGNEQELEAEGYLARVIQHENDHLEGVLFRDRAISIADVTEKQVEDGQEEDGQEEDTDKDDTDKVNADKVNADR